jgi:Rrf2 family transcriptional regulator, iron-sulfur cluster assembly transcription factor
LEDVNLTLSRRGDYVIRAALCLARAFDEGGYRKIREVVGDTDIPATFAAQILADLVRAGLATSKAGKQGGYRLTREPHEISVLEIIEAAEGPLRPEHCALGAGPCRWEQVCPLHETWSTATTGLRMALGDTSLAEVAARDLAIALGAYPIPEDSHRSNPVAVDISDRAQVELGSLDTHATLARTTAQLGYLLESSDAEVSLAPDAPRRHRTSPERYLVAWRLADPTRASRFEGQLTVDDVDDERCELELDGTWRLDGSAMGDTPAETRHRAQRTVRTFLRNLARTLESTAATDT